MATVNVCIHGRRDTAIEVGRIAENCNVITIGDRLNNLVIGNSIFIDNIPTVELENLIKGVKEVIRKRNTNK